MVESSMTLSGLLVAALLLQVLLAFGIWYDASRRRLEWGFGYFYGTMLPLVGYMFVPVYLSRRDEEPQYDQPDLAVEQPASGTAWEVKLPDPFGLPRRFAYVIVALWRRYWLYGILVATSLLFAAALAIDARANSAALSLCAAHWLFIWGTANGYRDAVVTIDIEDGTLTQRHVSGFIWEGSETETTVELAEIERVKAVPCGQHAMVRLGYEDWVKANGPLAVPVHRSRTQEVLALLESEDVQTETVGSRVAAIRLFGTVATLGMIPVAVTAVTGEFGSDLMFLFLLGVVAWIVAHTGGCTYVNT